MLIQCKVSGSCHFKFSSLIAVTDHSSVTTTLLDSGGKCLQRSNQKAFSEQSTVDRKCFCNHSYIQSHFKHICTGFFFLTRKIHPCLVLSPVSGKLQFWVQVKRQSTSIKGNKLRLQKSFLEPRTRSL